MAVAAVALVAAVESSARNASSCDGHGAYAVFVTRTTVVLVDKTNSHRDVFTACWRPTGHRYRLGTVSVGKHHARTSELDGFQINGPWLAWGQRSFVADGRSTMHSRNLRTGRRGPTVDVAAEGHDPSQTVLSETGGPVPLLDPPYYALATNGNYAWYAYGKAPSGQDAVAIYVPDDRGSDRRVDIGSPHGIKDFRIRGTTAYWTNHGRHRSLSLRHPHG